MHYVLPFMVRSTKNFSPILKSERRRTTIFYLPVAVPTETKDLIKGVFLEYLVPFNSIMVKEGESARDGAQEVPVVILTTPPALVKNPSAQSMLPITSPSIESLDLATQPPTRSVQRTRTASNGFPKLNPAASPTLRATSPEPEKKSKVRSVLDMFSFKGSKAEQASSPPTSNLKPSGNSLENLSVEKERNKKDCSVTVKGKDYPLDFVHV